MRSYAGLSLAWLMILAGCGAPPPGGGGGLPSPTPSPEATASALPPGPALRIDFTGMALGPLGAEAPFVDVYSELQAQGIAPPLWLYRGTWEITELATGSLIGRVLHQARVQERPPITLLRYRGDFEAQHDGLMPAHYRMAITQQPVRSPFNLPPTGDQGVQPYYLDPNHYVEVVTTPTQLQVWVCDGGLPDSSVGWNKLWFVDLTTRAGDVRRIGATVDVARHQFTVLLDDQPLATIVTPMIAPRPHWIALRAIGNEVNFADFALEALP